MTATKTTRSEPITLTLREVLEGAERAERRVAKWPEWKQNLSSTRPEGGSRGSTGEESR